MSTASPSGSGRDERPVRSTLRLKLVTVGAVVVVGLAGGVAVGANIGILDSSDDHGVGSLSAAGDLTPSTQVVDVYVDAPTTAAPAAAAGPTTVVDPGAMVPPVATGQAFAVDVAGTVTVDVISGTLQVTSVGPAAGWTWQLEPGTADQVAVTFIDATRTLHFVATRAADGSIAGRVDEPLAVATAPVPGGGGSQGDGDDEHEGGEHEGGEDDD